MSGHSKWATIKRQKGVTDAKRGQVFTKLAREITVATRSGLPDPESNYRLRLAVQKARAENMPKENIDRAIERAAGAGAGQSYDEVNYEVYGPGGIAMIIQAMTDNRNRTVGEVRAALTRAGVSLGESGSVAWMFDHVGRIAVNPGTSDPDDIAMVAIDGGALDVQVDDDVVEVFTELADLHRVQTLLADAGFDVDAVEAEMRPKTYVSPEPEASMKALRLVERLEDLDDVQQVYSNLELTDELLAQVS